MTRDAQNYFKVAPLYKYAKVRTLNEMLSKPQVVGVGIGYKTIGGKLTRDVSLIVIVNKKIKSRDLDKNEIVPKKVSLSSNDIYLRRPSSRKTKSSEILYFQTDVIESSLPSINMPPPGSSWNPLCVGGYNSSVDVYYGMPLFNDSKKWIGNCAFIARLMSSNHPALVTNLHTVSHCNRIYNYQGKLIAQSPSQIKPYDACYIPLLNGISYHNSKGSIEISHLNTGANCDWRYMSYSASSGFKKLRLWCDSISTTPSANLPPGVSLRLFVDAQNYKTNSATAEGDSATGILTYDGGLNSFHLGGTQYIGPNCQGQNQAKHKWAIAANHILNSNLKL